MRLRLLAPIAAALSLFLLITPCAATDSAVANGRAAAAFTDVPSGSWYAASVKTCSDAGLINGTSPTTFSPSKTLTAAELEALAARLSLYLAGENPSTGIAAASAGTGSAEILRADGSALPRTALYGCALLGDGSRSFYLHLARDAFPNGAPDQITLRVDGTYDFIGTGYDNLFSGDWVGYRFRISQADFQSHDPFTKIAMQTARPGNFTDAWYWGADSYLKNLPDAPAALFNPYLQLPADRTYTAQLLYFVTPENLLTPVRSGSLPDSSDEAATALYRAGILNGMDEDGNFLGESHLTRAQAAAIFARIISR